MLLNILIQQPANHSLIGGVVRFGLGLKELDTLFAEGNRDLDDALRLGQLYPNSRYGRFSQAMPLPLGSRLWISRPVTRKQYSKQD